MGISLYTSRVILAALGVEDYGIYNVVGGIVSLFAFINGAMSLTAQRYIAYELGQGNGNQVRQVFSTCVIIHGLIAALIFILAESIGLYLLEVHLTIPPERMQCSSLGLPIFHPELHCNDVVHSVQWRNRCI